MHLNTPHYLLPAPQGVTLLQKAPARHAAPTSVLLQQVPLLDASEGVGQAGLAHAGVSQQHHAVLPAAGGGRGLGGPTAPRCCGSGSRFGRGLPELGVAELSPRRGPRYPRQRGAGPPPQRAFAPGLRVEGHLGLGEAAPMGRGSLQPPGLAAPRPRALPRRSRSERLKLSPDRADVRRPAPEPRGFKAREVEPPAAAGPSLAPLPDLPRPSAAAPAARLRAPPGLRPVPEAPAGLPVPPVWGWARFPSQGSPGGRSRPVPGCRRWSMAAGRPGGSAALPSRVGSDPRAPRPAPPGSMARRGRARLRRLAK